MTTFAKRLKSLRAEKKIKSTQLGDAIGVTYNAISQYENEKRNPSRANLEKLADYFNVDMDYLMGKSDVRRACDLQGVVDNKINSDEISLILSFRKADKKTQGIILNLLDLK